MNADLGSLRRPVRTVLRWQLIVTAGLTLAGGILAGVDGALSANPFRQGAEDVGMIAPQRAANRSAQSLRASG